MSNRSFVALCKRGNERSIIFFLFSTEQQKEQLLFRSFKKSNKKSDHSFALSIRVKEQK